MGQQQLLLLVLGIVIVGLAVVGGIQAFAENGRKSAFDEAATRNAGFVGIATAWRMTPQALGGGQGAPDSRALGLSVFGLSPTETLFQNDNATGGVVAPGKAVVVYYRTSGAAGPTVETWDRDHNIKITTFLYGTSPRCHVFRYGYKDGPPATNWTDFQRSSGSAQWTYDPANVPPAPAGCAW